jgi:hypothetical protein
VIEKKLPTAQPYLNWSISDLLVQRGYSLYEQEEMDIEHYDYIVQLMLKEGDKPKQQTLGI